MRQPKTIPTRPPRSGCAASSSSTDPATGQSGAPAPDVITGE